MKNWLKITLLAIMCALPLAACTSPADEPAPTAEEAAALNTDLPPDQCTARQTLPDGTVVEQCCLEGEASCPNGQTWSYVCASRVRALAQCQAVCGTACVRWEGNSCQY